jgi:hypothetical protein
VALHDASRGLRDALLVARPTVRHEERLPPAHAHDHRHRHRLSYVFVHRRSLPAPALQGGERLQFECKIARSRHTPKFLLVR